MARGMASIVLAEMHGCKSRLILEDGSPSSIGRSGSFISRLCGSTGKTFAGRRLDRGLGSEGHATGGAAASKTGAFVSSLHSFEPGFPGNINNLDVKLWYLYP